MYTFYISTFVYILTLHCFLCLYYVRLLHLSLGSQNQAYHPRVIYSLQSYGDTMPRTAQICYTNCDIPGSSFLLLNADISKMATPTLADAAIKKSIALLLLLAISINDPYIAAGFFSPFAPKSDAELWDTIFLW